MPKHIDEIKTKASIESPKKVCLKENKTLNHDMLESTTKFISESNKA